MKKKNIFILVGHPDTNSLSTTLAEGYKTAAEKAGHTVKFCQLSQLKFDPILHYGYNKRMDLEPDLIQFQQDILWAEHFVLVFPTWWGTMPALLKGLFDRAWLPRFAYRFHENGLGWSRLLKGRSARIITTSNSPIFILHLFFGARLAELRWLTLWFVGYSPVRMTRFSRMAKATPEAVIKALKKVAKLGAKGV